MKIWSVLVALLMFTGPAAAQSLAEQPFSFRWKAVEGAGGYRVEIRQREGEALLTQAVDADQTNLAVNLVPGPYELKVTTLNRLGQDESSTAWTPFHVAAPSAPDWDEGAATGLTFGSSGTLVLSVHGWAVDGTAELRSPRGRTLVLVPRRGDNGRVTLDVPALAERGDWKLLLTNPPQKTAPALTVTVRYPELSVKGLEPTEIPASADPAALVVHATGASPEFVASLRPEEGPSRTLVVSDKTQNAVTLQIPGGLPPGPYQLVLANAADLRPVDPLSLWIGFPDDGTYPRVTTLGTKTSFQAMGGIAFDNSDTYYVSDTAAHLIRRIGPDGEAVFMGSGQPGFSNGGFLAPPVSFNQPRGLVRDAAGNLFVADSGNHVIRKITPNGTVSTWAGSGKPGLDDGKGDRASFNDPRGLALDLYGTLWVADTGNGCVRRIDADGAVTTVSWQAAMRSPEFLAVSPDGSVYISDTGKRSVWFLAADAPVWRFSLPQVDLPPTVLDPRGLSLDLWGNLYIADGAGHRVWRRRTNGDVEPWVGYRLPGRSDGVSIGASFDTPTVLATSGADLAVADAGNGLVRKVAQPSDLRQFDAAFASTVARQPELRFPVAVALTPQARFYLDGNRILRDDGTISTWAGTDAPGDQDGSLSEARFRSPQEIVAATDGTLFLSDTGNNCIRKISPDGRVTTVARSLSRPEGLAVDGEGTLFVVDRDRGLVLKVLSDGRQTTVLSGLKDPRGVAIDPFGNLYVAEAAMVWKVNPRGQRALLAGSAEYGDFSDLRRVVLASDGTLFATDLGRNAIFSINPSGWVQTLVGTPGGEPGYEDGKEATASRPQGLAVDAQGTVFWADSMNQAIRRLVVNATVAPVGDTVVVEEATSDVASRRSIQIDGDIEDWQGMKPILTGRVTGPQRGAPGTQPNAVYLAQDDEYLYWLMTFIDGQPGIGGAKWGYTLVFNDAIQPGVHLVLDTRPGNPTVNQGNINTGPHPTGSRWRNAWQNNGSVHWASGKNFIEVRYPLKVLQEQLKVGRSYTLLAGLSDSVVTLGYRPFTW